MPALIHIGWPKTATTYLQRHLFPCFGASYLGKPYLDKEFFRAFRKVLFLDDIHLGQTDALDRLSNLVRSLPSPAILSSEGLAVPHTRTETPSADRRLIARRLQAVFGRDTRILITIREQRSWLKSQYLYAMRRGVYSGHYQSPATWFMRHYKSESRGVLGSCDYWPVISQYCSIFGDDNVLVLTFEELVSDLAANGRRIASFAGYTLPADWSAPAERVNERTSHRHLAFGRFNARFMPTIIRAICAQTTPDWIKVKFDEWLRHGSRASAELGQFDSICRDLYVPGNAMLQGAGIPVERYGYLLN